MGNRGKWGLLETICSRRPFVHQIGRKKSFSRLYLICMQIVERKTFCTVFNWEGIFGMEGVVFYRWLWRNRLEHGQYGRFYWIRSLYLNRRMAHGRRADRSICRHRHCMQYCSDFLIQNNLNGKFILIAHWHIQKETINLKMVRKLQLSTNLNKVPTNCSVPSSKTPLFS